MKAATTVRKVCMVLSAFLTGSSLGISQLAEKTGLLPSDVHRIIKSLEQFDYIEQDLETKKYHLGLELLKLGHVVNRRIELVRVARPFLLRLAQDSQAASNLAIFDEWSLEAIFVAQVDSPNEVQIRVRVGSVASLHATALGKVLTAHLEPHTARRALKKNGMPKRTANTITDVARLFRELKQVRTQGYAMDREEAVEGACCIAAPVYDHRGEVVAATSMSMLATRLASQSEPSLVSMVKATAARISAALGFEIRYTRRSPASPVNRREVSL